MSKYYKVIETSSAKEVDRLLDENWELIETSKRHRDLNEEYIVYHLGLPERAVINQLKEIVKTYEKHELKEVLFAKIAEGNGHNYKDYEEGFGTADENPTVSFMQNYEKVVNNRTVSYDDKSKVVHFK